MGEPQAVLPALSGGCIRHGASSSDSLPMVQLLVQMMYITLLQPRSTHDGGGLTPCHAGRVHVWARLEGSESFRTVLCGTNFLSSPEGATEISLPTYLSTGHLQTVVPPNVAVDRNAPAARLHAPELLVLISTTSSFFALRVPLFEISSAKKSPSL